MNQTSVIFKCSAASCLNLSSLVFFFFFCTQDARNLSVHKISSNMVDGRNAPHFLLKRHLIFLSHSRFSLSFSIHHILYKRHSDEPYKLSFLFQLYFAITADHIEGMQLCAITNFFLIKQHAQNFLYRFYQHIRGTAFEGSWQCRVWKHI